MPNFKERNPLRTKQSEQDLKWKNTDYIFWLYTNIKYKFVQYFYLSIHSYSILLTQQRVVLDLEPIPGGAGHQAGEHPGKHASSLLDARAAFGFVQ